MRILAAALSLLALGAASPIAPPSAPAEMPRPAERATLTKIDADTWLDGFLPYALKRGDIAGAVVTIVRDGEILTSRGFGYADVDARQPVDAERTIFRPGSVSKLFTWTAVMQLVEKGQLDLDADINTYLDFRIPPAFGRPVTLRHLMTHSAGFEEAVRGLITPDRRNVGLEENLKRWVPARVYPPGTTPAYSNYGTALAGYIVQRKSGLPFETYVEREVFEPLEMRSSSFRQPLPGALKARMSKGYVAASAPAGGFEYVSFAPAGSLASTGPDMGNFMIAHLNGGAFRGKQILRSATAELMHSSALTVIPGLNRMKLGFYEQDRNGHRILSHAGDTMLFHSELNLFPDDNVGVFISFNSLGKGAAVAALRTAFLEGFTDRYFPASPSMPARVKDLASAKNHAAMAAGVYDNSRRSHSNFLAGLALFGQNQIIDNGDGTITVPTQEDAAGNPKRWHEISPFLWQEEGGTARLGAVVRDGSVVRYSVDDVSPFMVWDRAPWWRSTTWIAPALKLALAVFLLTLLAWPAGALLRRYAGTSPLGVAGAKWPRAGIRLCAALLLVAVAGWMSVVAALSANLSPDHAFDVKLHILNVLMIAGSFGGLIAACAYLWLLRAPGAGRMRRVWILILIAGFAIFCWVTAVFHLGDFSTQF